MAGQEDDCDSLDHILRMINRNDDANRSYNQFNHVSSFGVGGRISTVVDPEFRPPSAIQAPITTITNQSTDMFNPFNGSASNNPNQNSNPPQTQPIMQNNPQNPNVNYQNTLSSDMVPNLGYNATNHHQMAGQIQVQNPMGQQAARLSGPVLSNQLSVTSNLSVPSGTAPFTIHGSPTTFQDIARRPPTMNNYAANSFNIMSNTLNEYGPPVNHDPHRVHGGLSHQTFAPSASRPQSEYPMGPAPMISMSMPMGPVRPASAGSVVSNRGLLPMGPAPLGYAAPASDTVRKGISPPPSPPPEPPSLTGSTAQLNKNPIAVPTSRPSSLGPPSDRVIYSPPAVTKSPPLDQIVSADGKLDTDRHRSADMTSSGKIPKVRAPPNKKDNLDGMTMIELQQRYRDYEADMLSNQKRLQSIERSLNDLTRSAKGRNIELDPKFKNLKDDQRKHKDDAHNIRNFMKKIEDKLLSKFNHRINPKESKSAMRAAPSQQTPSRRAKMSTTSHKDKQGARSRSSSSEPKLSLRMKDSKTWCDKCDEHFDSLMAYCDHLHTRDHKRCMIKCSPWASSRGPERFSLKQTYAELKSICSRVSDELRGDNFDLRDLDRVINYPIEDRDQVLKVRHLERERNNIEEDDPLFHYKGYDNLLPISGFYCTLCSKTLCDNQDAERHLSSLEHNAAHAKSVALNRDHEKTFRIKMAKSHKELFGDKPKQSPKKSKNQSASSAPEQGPSQMRTTKSHDPVPSTSGTNSAAKPSNIPVLAFLPSTIRSSTMASATKKSNSTVVSLESRIASTSDTSTTTTTTTTTAAVHHQYKKATSHIVDEHEAVVDKFPESVPEAAKKKATHKSPEKRKTKPNNEPARKRASTQIMALGEISRPTALKRLKKSSTMPKSKPIVESSDDDSTDSDVIGKKIVSKKTRPDPVVRDSDEDGETTEEERDDDVQFLKEVHLDRGDPDSPFPDLELSVTGNIHVSALKDPRLSAKCTVRLAPLNLDSYKDMLLDKASVWARLNQIIAKKEPGQLSKEARKGIEEVEPTYLDVDGNHVPIEIEDDDQGPQK